MLLWRYSQLFPSWLAFGNGGIWQVESHLCVKQMYYYLTRKCKKNYYYFTRKCKTLPPTIWKWDHHKLCGRPFPGIFLEMPVFSQIFKLLNSQKTSQELRMLSLSLFIQGSLWMLRLLFSIVRNVTRVSNVTRLWDCSLRVFLQLSLSLSFSLYLSLSLSFC